MKQFAAFILTLLYAGYALAGLGIVSAPGIKAAGDQLGVYQTPAISELTHGEDYLHKSIHLKKISQHVARPGKIKMPGVAATTVWLQSVSPKLPAIASHYYRHSANVPLPTQTLYLKNRALLI